jgi:hypothetical protein
MSIDTAVAGDGDPTVAGTGRPWRRWAWRAGAAGLLLTILVVLLAWRYQHLLATATGSPGGDLRDAPCLPGQAVEIMDSPHISPAEAGGVRYNSLPPTSGPHFSFTLATGQYDAPVPDGLAVHALEHGHVVIHYAAGTPDPEVRELTRLAKRYSGDVILAPRPDLAGGIALTAWGRIDLFDHYDEVRISSFVEHLRGRYHHGWVAPDLC